VRKKAQEKEFKHTCFMLHLLNVCRQESTDTVVNRQKLRTHQKLFRHSPKNSIFRQKIARTSTWKYFFECLRLLRKAECQRGFGADEKRIRWWRAIYYRADKTYRKSKTTITSWTLRQRMLRWAFTGDDATTGATNVR